MATDSVLNNYEDEIEGILLSEEIIDGFLCSEVNITNEYSQEKTEWKISRNITIEIGKIWLKEHDRFMKAVNLVTSKIKELANISSDNLERVLVVGLGNNSSIADSLGASVLSNVLITRYLNVPVNYELSEIMGIEPRVFGQTGMETAEIVLSVTEKIKPSLVILIDSLATHHISRLATTIQLTNAGISPGSGVGNHRQSIDSELLGIPVITIGVPLVINAITLSHNILEEAYERIDIEANEKLTIETLSSVLGESRGDFFVIPREIDLIISEVSKIIGYGINRCFYDWLSIEEMARLCGPR